MTKINSPTSILEFGSTHLHLAVYDKIVFNQCSFYKEKINYTRIEDTLKDQPIFDLITKAENDLNKHLNEITLLIDSPTIYSLDFSIQKIFDKKIITKTEIDYLINDCENIIKINNIDKEILHTLKHQIIIDDKENEYKNDITIEAHKVTIDLKFILIEKKLCDILKKLFLKKHITIKNIFCTSYIKSLEIINKNEIKGYSSFIDIGLKKSSLSIFKDNKLLYLNNTFVGGDHVTKDISKVLKLDYRKAESEKFKFSKYNNSEINLINNTDNELLRKIINSRLEEIIELLFLDCPVKNNFDPLSNLKLYFIGNGSKVLNDNLLSFGQEFNFIKEMSIIEDEAKDCCDGAMKFLASYTDNNMPKPSISLENKGFFEKLFDYFSSK